MTELYFIDGSGDMDRSDKDKKSRTTRDADETSDSSALGRVGGARDRRNFGDLGGAAIGCREGLVCTPVSIDRSECLPENLNGNHSQEYIIMHTINVHIIVASSPSSFPAY